MSGKTVCEGRGQEFWDSRSAKQDAVSNIIRNPVTLEVYELHVEALSNGVRSPCKNVPSTITRENRRLVYRSSVVNSRVVPHPELSRNGVVGNKSCLVAYCLRIGHRARCAAIDFLCRRQVHL